MFSTTAIAAYNVALEPSEIQYDTSDNVETRLPKPAANTSTAPMMISLNLSTFLSFRLTERQKRA